MKVTVTIKGVSPLLMHRFPLGEAEAFEKWSVEKQAEWAAYRTDKGGLYLPGWNLMRALVSAASYSKGKGRGNLSRVAAATLSVSPGELDLHQKTYEIDIRNVKNPVTRGRHQRVRPRLDSWGVAFTLEWDDTLLTEKQARDIVDNAGRRVGVLDYRPEMKGPYGRFMVTEWK